jgi:hypothetical protein
MAGNALYGTLPQSWFGPSAFALRLLTLDVSDNQLSGTIPSGAMVSCALFADPQARVHAHKSYSSYAPALLLVATTPPHIMQQ